MPLSDIRSHRYSWGDGHVFQMSVSFVFSACAHDVLQDTEKEHRCVPHSGALFRPPPLEVVAIFHTVCNLISGAFHPVLWLTLLLWLVPVIGAAIPLVTRLSVFPQDHCRSGTLVPKQLVRIRFVLLGALRISLHSEILMKTLALSLQR